MHGRDQDFTQPKPKQRHARSACLPCRKKKVRCNNGRPACSNCELYGTQCTFGDDKRRTHSTNKIISQLTERLTEVEAHLVQASSSDSAARRDRLTPPSSLLDQDPAGDKAGDPCLDSNLTGPAGHADGSAMTPITFQDIDLDFWGQFNETQTDLTGLPDLDPSLDVLPEHGSDLQVRTCPGDTTIQQQAIARASSFSSDAVSDQPRMPSQSPEDMVLPNLHPHTFDQGSRDRDDDITEQISSRLGRMCLTEGGQMRYFGATSNFSMLPNEVRNLYHTDMSDFRHECELAVERAGLAWKTDAEYELHLTRLYFAWHNYWVTEVGESSYFHHKQLYYQGYETVQFSPALENAILSIGALYSTRSPPPTIREKPSDFFGARTRLYLEREMDRPTIATTQAAVVLSALESANGCDSRGWIYSGVAVQMMTELGLHVHLDSKDSRLCPDNNLRAIEGVRRSLFWTVYTADMFHSSYNGRPYLFNRIRYDGPGFQASDCSKWQPFHTNGAPFKLPSGVNISSVNAVSTHVVQIAIKQRKIHDSLYSWDGSVSKDVKDSVSSLAQQLQQWHNTLPQALLVDYSQEEPTPPPAPLVIQLHMLYNQTLIFLNRPFVRHDPDSDLQAGKVCTNAALSICRLLRVYKSNYGLRYLNVHAVCCTVSAGVVHAYDSCMRPGILGKKAQGDFELCVQALAEMGQTFRNGMHGLDVLISLRRAWQQQMFKEVGSKRRWAALSSSVEPRGA